jgi:hypothetical protein
MKRFVLVKSYSKVLDVISWGLKIAWILKRLDEGMTTLLGAR